MRESSEELTAADEGSCPKTWLLPVPPAAAAAAPNLPERYLLRPHPRATESETLEVGLSSLSCFWFF